MSGIDGTVLRRARHLGAAAAIALVAILALTATSGQRTTPPVRQVVLEARGATFHQDGVGPNPTIEARVGERLRLVLRNTDSGVLHSIAVPELSGTVRHVRWGEQGGLEIVPREPGSYLYTCPQHCPRMRGRIVVRR